MIKNILPDVEELSGLAERSDRLSPVLSWADFGLCFRAGLLGAVFFLYWPVYLLLPWPLVTSEVTASTEDSPKKIRQKICQKNSSKKFVKKFVEKIRQKNSSKKYSP